MEYNITADILGQKIFECVQGETFIFYDACQK